MFNLLSREYETSQYKLERKCRKKIHNNRNERGFLFLFTWNYQESVGT